MPVARRFVVITIICLISATAFGGERHRVVPSVATRFCDFGTDVVGVTVPAEFCIRKFADVPTPRVLLFAPNGDLFVSSPQRQTVGGAPPGAGAIFLFRETDAAKPPQRYAFAEGPAYFAVHGILIAQDWFYYTLDDAVYRVPFALGATQIDVGARRMVASFTTDIPALSKWGEPVLLGPGSIHVAHTDREYISKKQLHEAVDLYCDVARKLLI